MFFKLSDKKIHSFYRGNKEISEKRLIMFVRMKKRGDAYRQDYDFEFFRLGRIHHGSSAVYHQE